MDSESLCEESQIQLRQARTSSLVALETEALNGHYETSNYQDGGCLECSGHDLKAKKALKRPFYGAGSRFVSGTGPIGAR